MNNLFILSVDFDSTNEESELNVEHIGGIFTRQRVAEKEGVRLLRKNECKEARVYEFPGVLLNQCLTAKGFLKYCIPVFSTDQTVMDTIRQNKKTPSPAVETELITDELN